MTRVKTTDGGKGGWPLHGLVAFSERARVGLMYANY